MRILNHIILLVALVTALIFAVVNKSFLQTYTHVYLYFGTAYIPLTLIVFLSGVGALILQWLITQLAWILHRKKLEGREKEIVLLKAKLYDLTEGSWKNEIKDSIAETRKGLREDIKWLAAQMYYGPPVQLRKEQQERGDLPALPQEANR